MIKLFHNVMYHGSVPWSYGSSYREFSITAEKDHLHKGEKVLVEISRLDCRVFLGNRRKHELLRIPGVMILWVTNCDISKTVCLFDSYTTPSCVHVFVTKNHEELFRYIRHRLGVSHRMEKAKGEFHGLGIYAPMKNIEELLVVLPLAFEAKLVGSIAGGTATASANSAEREAAKLLKRRRGEDELGMKGNPVTLIAHREGMRVLDAMTRASILQISIESMTDITNFEIDAKCIFSVVVYDDRTDSSTTWLYICAEQQAQKLTWILNMLKKAAVFKQDTLTVLKSPFVKRKAGLPKTKSYSANGNAMAISIPPELLSRSILRDRLVFVKTLHSGEFGKHHLASYFDIETSVNKNEDPLQLNVLSLYDDLATMDQERVIDMCMPLLELEHKNIIRLFGVCLEASPWLIVYEPATLGSFTNILSSCASKNIPIGLENKVHLGIQLAEALEFLHSSQFVHMDVRAENCLVSKGGVLKLSGFENCKRYDPGTQSHVLRGRAKLSLRWLAPEIFTQSPRVFSECTDVWAFAITMVEFITEMIPYPTLNLRAVKKSVANGVRPACPSDCPSYLWDVLNVCMDEECLMRPTFSEIIDSLNDVLQQLNKEPSAEYLDKMNRMLTQRFDHLTVEAIDAYRRESLRKQKEGQNNWVAGHIETMGQVRENPLFGRMESIWSMDLDVFDKDDDDEDSSEEDEESEEDYIVVQGSNSEDNYIVVQGEHAHSNHSDAHHKAVKQILDPNSNYLGVSNNGNYMTVGKIEDPNEGYMRVGPTSSNSGNYMTVGKIEDPNEGYMRVGPSSNSGNYMTVGKIEDPNEGYMRVGPSSNGDYMTVGKIEDPNAGYLKVGPKHDPDAGYLKIGRDKSRVYKPKAPVRQQVYYDYSISPEQGDEDGEEDDDYISGEEFGYIRVDNSGPISKKKNKKKKKPVEMFYEDAEGYLWMDDSNMKII